MVRSYSTYLQSCMVPYYPLELYPQASPLLSPAREWGEWGSPHSLVLRQPCIDVQWNDHAHRLLLDVLSKLSELDVAAAGKEAVEVVRRRGDLIH